MPVFALLENIIYNHYLNKIFRLFQLYNRNRTCFLCFQLKKSIRYEPSYKIIEIKSLLSSLFSLLVIIPLLFFITVLLILFKNVAHPRIHFLCILIQLLHLYSFISFVKNQTKLVLLEGILTQIVLFLSRPLHRRRKQRV